jgi:hypothetical protein
MDPSETRIETTGNAVKDVSEGVANIAETAKDAAEAVVAEAETVVAETAEDIATITEDAAVAETVATTTEPEPAAEAAACCPMKPCVGAIIAGVVVLVIVVVAFARRKKTCKAKSEKSKNGNGAAVEIYVGNLSYDMNDAQLRREFERYGVVKSARIITNRSNNKSKGYGFVEMPHRKEALIAIKALDNAEVMTRRIRVNEARANTKPPEDR